MKLKKCKHQYKNAGGMRNKGMRYRCIKCGKSKIK